MEQSIRMRERVRVVLIDPSSFVLGELQAVLSKNSRILVAGTARTESEALSLLRSGRPDVVVLDVQVGRANGIHLCWVIRQSYPNTAVLFFTADDDESTLRSAVLAGAQGYLLKDTPGEAVAKSIEIVAAGRAMMDQRLTRHLLEWVRDGRPAAPRERMGEYTTADVRVLSLIAAGKSNKEIAQELGI